MWSDRQPSCPNNTDVLDMRSWARVLAALLTHGKPGICAQSKHLFVSQVAAIMLRVPSAGVQAYHRGSVHTRYLLDDATRHNSPTVLIRHF